MPSPSTSPSSATSAGARSRSRSPLPIPDGRARRRRVRSIASSSTRRPKQFIADRMWAGASLIVSDYGLSNEAGKYTDFIVQPR